MKKCIKFLFTISFTICICIMNLKAGESRGASEQTYALTIGYDIGGELPQNSTSTTIPNGSTGEGTAQYTYNNAFALKVSLVNQELVKQNDLDYVQSTYYYLPIEGKDWPKYSLDYYKNDWDIMMGYFKDIAGSKVYGVMDKKTGLYTTNFEVANSFNSGESWFYFRTLVTYDYYEDGVQKQAGQWFVNSDLVHQAMVGDGHWSGLYQTLIDLKICDTKAFNSFLSGKCTNVETLRNAIENVADGGTGELGLFDKYIVVFEPVYRFTVGGTRDVVHYTIKGMANKVLEENKNYFGLMNTYTFTLMDASLPHGKINKNGRKTLANLGVDTSKAVLTNEQLEYLSRIDTGYGYGIYTLSELPNGAHNCHIANNKYYGIDGKEIEGTTETEKKIKFNEQCGCHYDKESGTYYGPLKMEDIKAGISLNALSNWAQYVEQCGCHTEEINGKTTYFGPLNNDLTVKNYGTDNKAKEDYLKTCGCRYDEYTKNYYGPNNENLGTDENKYEELCTFKCQIIDGKYYDVDGKVINKTNKQSLLKAYYGSCGCRKEENNGKTYYYSINNEYLGEGEEAKTKYDEECSCQYPDNMGNFRGKDGEIIPYSINIEEDYLKVCPFTCKIDSKGKYHLADGSVGTKEQFEEQCKTVCDSKTYCVTSKEKNSLFGKTNTKYFSYIINENDSCNEEKVTVYYDINGFGRQTEKEMLDSCKCTQSPVNKKYYDLNSKVVTSEEEIEFIKNGCTVIQKDKCEIKDKNEMPTNCNDKTTGIIEDPSMCAILNPSTQDKVKSDNYKTNYISNNDYCSIYCRNAYEYKFMDKAEALAGSFFRYDIKKDNPGLSVIVKVKKECTSLIDYDKWLNDYKEANEKVRTTYNKYAKMLAQELTAGEGIVETETCYGGTEEKCSCAKYKDIVNPALTACHTACGSDKDPVGCADKCDDTIENTIEGNASNSTCETYNSGKTCSSATLSCTSYDWSGAKYIEMNSSGVGVVTDASGSSSCSITCDYNCRGCANSSYNGVKPSSTSAKNAYESAVKERDALIEKIKNCNFEGSGIINKIEKDMPNDEIKIAYEEKYSNKIVIKSENISTKKTFTYGTSSSWKDYCKECDGELSLGTSQIEKVTNWSCSGTYNSGTKTYNSKCDNEKSEVPSNKAAHLVIEKENGYYQSTNFAVNIYTGIINDSVGSKNSLSLGERVYPVENKKTTEGKVTVDWDAKNVTGTYTCYYNVINETKQYDCEDGYYNHICTPNNSNVNSVGLGYYYRTVNLENLFNFTTLPSNWSTSNGQKAKTKIEETGNDIWINQKPAYTVTLTSDGITNIKKYNKQQESIGGYLNNSLDCDTSSLKCKSTFIEEDIKGLSGVTISKDLSEDNIHYYTK